MPHFSTLSDWRLDSCHPDLGRLFREVVKHFDCSVIYGRRTTEEQIALYAKGRTAPGKIVTYCDGVTKKSNHQAKADGLSWAVDAAPYPIDWKDEKRF